MGAPHSHIDAISVPFFVRITDSRIWVRFDRDVHSKILVTVFASRWPKTFLKKSAANLLLGR